MRELLWYYTLHVQCTTVYCTCTSILRLVHGLHVLVHMYSSHCMVGCYMYDIGKDSIVQSASYSAHRVCWKFDSITRVVPYMYVYMYMFLAGWKSSSAIDAVWKHFVISRSLSVPSFFFIVNFLLHHQSSLHLQSFTSSMAMKNMLASATWPEE